MYENTFNNIEKTLRAEEGVSNELDYVEQISWVLFLKYLSDYEGDRRDRSELEGKSHTPLLDAEYKWDAWASPKDAYVEAGERELNNERLGRHIEAAYGSLGDGRSKLGETSDIRDAYLELQSDLCKGARGRNE